MNRQYQPSPFFLLFGLKLRGITFAEAETLGSGCSLTVDELVNYFSKCKPSLSDKYLDD